MARSKKLQEQEINKVEEEKVVKNNKLVEFDRVTEVNDGKVLWKTRMLLFGGNVTVNGKIVTKSCKFNVDPGKVKTKWDSRSVFEEVSEYIPDNAEELSDDVRRMLGYLTKEELDAMRKINPNAKIYPMDDFVHQMNLSGGAEFHPKRELDRGGWIDEYWDDQIFFTLVQNGIPVMKNQRLRKNMKQLFFKTFMEKNFGVTPSKFADPNKSILADIEAGFYEKLPKTTNVIWWSGYRTKDGAMDIDRTVADLNKDRWYRGFGYMVVVSDPVDDKGNCIGLCIKAFIRMSKGGRLYLDTPGYNMNRINLTRWFESNPGVENKWIDLEKEVLLEGVKLEDVPEDLRKLFRNDGKLFQNNIDYVNFRTNASSGFESITQRDENGAFVGPIVYCNGQVKDQVLQGLLDSLEARGYKIPSKETSAEGDAAYTQQFGGVLESIKL